MDLNLIEQRLKSGSRLGERETRGLRELVEVGRSEEADRAMQLMHAYPAEASVGRGDKVLLERVVDDAEAPHRAAHALSLLCNWLSLAGEELGRILFALATRTEGGDYLCITACSCAALVLRESPEPRLARLLVEVFRDRTRLTSTRESARDALLVIDGMAQRDIVAAEFSDPRSLHERAERVASRLLSIA